MISWDKTNLLMDVTFVHEGGRWYVQENGGLVHIKRAAIIPNYDDLEFILHVGSEQVSLTTKGREFDHPVVRIKPRGDVVKFELENDRVMVIDLGDNPGLQAVVRHMLQRGTVLKRGKPLTSL